MIVFERFHNAPKVDMPLAAPEHPVSATDGNPTVMLALTLAAFALHVWLAPPAPVRAPVVVKPLPLPTMAEDCRAQNYAVGGRLLAQCDMVEES